VLKLFFIFRTALYWQKQSATNMHHVQQARYFWLSVSHGTIKPLTHLISMKQFFILLFMILLGLQAQAQGKAVRFAQETLFFPANFGTRQGQGRGCL
jgi:hypothetical protein